jgi:hypothetical protein
MINRVSLFLSFLILILSFIVSSESAYAIDNIAKNTSVQTKVESQPDISSKEVSEIEIDPTNEDIENVKFKDATGISNEQGLSSEYVVISEQSENCNEESCPTFTVETLGENVVVKEDNINVLVTEPIKIKNSKITIEVEGRSEIVISPSQVRQLVESNLEGYGAQKADIVNIELGSCKSSDGPEQDCTYEEPIYTVDVEKQHKFLRIVPVKTDIQYIFSASNGNMLEENLPWYLKYFPVMFK